MLLVIDSWDPVLAGAGLLSDILAAAPGVKILATSREALNLHEEWSYPIGGLDVPETDDAPDLSWYSGVRLFVQSARRVQYDFKLSDDNRRVVAQICRYVEGLPLAIELAASWLRGLTCAEIAAELQRGLDLLTSPFRNVPARHRSMRAVFEQSWRLLSAEEQAVFSRLSVFRGGFQWEAAGQVAGASIPTLAGLIGKSLLRRTAGRYEWHELVRQFTAEKLALTPLACFRHRTSVLIAL